MLRDIWREVRDNPPLAIALFCMLVLIGLLYILPIGSARGHEHHRTDSAWEALTPEVKEWYRTLMQPDVPTASCCGEADQYWCDDYYARDGRAFCRITDDRDDAQFKRPHIDVGTEIEIPPHKLKFDRGNPTGHSIVFLRADRYVFCFVQGGGV